MKFLREDTHIIFDEDKPFDRHNPENAATAIELALPTGFSDKAKACWNYFDGTAFLYEYKGQLVATDESRELTYAGDGTLESPLGGPRWVCNSWEKLERGLELTYDELPYQKYEFKLLNKDTKNIYFGWGHGRTVEEAIQHHNFWSAPGEKIGGKFEIIEAKDIDFTDEYPYEAEDLLKKAFANKEEVLKKLEVSVADQQDKEDMKAVVENEAPWDFCRLDTIVRDQLCELVKGN